MHYVEGANATQLARMQELASRLWSWSSRWHAGELTWAWWENGGPAASWRMATWDYNGHPVAWALSKSPGRLDLQVDPAHSELVAEVLEWYAESVGGGKPVITVMDAETVLINALTGRGYVLDASEPFFAHLRRDLDDPLPVPSVPPNMTLRAAQNADDAEERAAAHRAAFASYGGEHEVTADAYRQIMSDELYRAELDWFVEDADGTVAAFCLVWLGEKNDTAVLEPVGTHPRYRRQGLARAVIAASLQAAAERGARHARVCARGDSGYVAAAATYTDIGFSRYGRNVRLIHPGRA